MIILYTFIFLEETFYGIVLVLEFNGQQVCAHFTTGLARFIPRGLTPNIVTPESS